MLGPVAAAADVREQSIGFVVVDSLLDLPIDLFVVATHRAAHAPYVVNDFEYASADEFVVTDERQHLNEVEIASDQILLMICDSDLNDFADLSFVIAVVSQASNDSASVRLSCVDTVHSDPFAHGHSRHAVSADPADVVSSHLDRSQHMIDCLAGLVALPDTLDALHFVNNAVAVIFAAFAESVADLNCHKLVVASSCLVALEIAFFAVPVACTVTCVGDMQPPLRPIAFAIVAVLVVPFVDARNPLQRPMDTEMLEHCWVLPSRPIHQGRLIRQHADRPFRTYCRLAIDKLDTAIAAEIVAAMDVELDVWHMHLAVPLDAPQLQSHHIDSMHLCSKKRNRKNEKHFHEFDRRKGYYLLLCV